MENKILLTKNSEWGSVAKEIIELSNENLKDYKLLGKSFGVNVDHCLFLAGQHKPDFWNRVVGFKEDKNNPTVKIFSEKTKKSYIVIAFYEHKEQNL